MVMGACLWIPRALWHEIGGFPEWFGSMAEDMYLCCVARLWGYPVRVLPSSGFRHWVGHSFGGGKVTAGGKLATSRKRRALSERNKTLVMALTYPQPVLTFALPLHLLALSLEGTFLVAIKRDTRLFREIYCTALKGLIVFSPLLRVLRNRIFHRHKPSIQAWYSVFRWMPRKLEIWRKHGIPTIM